MCWLAVLPLILFAFVGVASLVVTLLVERGERLRLRRHPPRLARRFRPVVIQGGKLPDLAAAAAAEPKESKIA